MLFRRELDKTTLASLKEKSREERAQFFNGSKVELMDELLNAVNGGTAAAMGENPNSEASYGNYWFSSFRCVCNGTVIC